MIFSFYELMNKPSQSMCIKKTKLSFFSSSYRLYVDLVMQDNKDRDAERDEVSHSCYEHE